MRKSIEIVQYHVQDISGTINLDMNIIGSKSMSHRALILAALANGKTVLHNLSNCEDVILTQIALQQLGISIEKSNKSLIVHGNNGNFSNQTQNILKLGDSGTSYRFLLSIAGILQSPTELHGSFRMEQRPIRELTDILEAGGVNIKFLKKDGFPPIKVNGPFQGGDFSISCSRSSQFVSSLLLIGPLLTQGLYLTLNGIPRSTPYIDMTCAMIRNFGVKLQKLSNPETSISIFPHQQYIAQNIEIEGDFSGAAFFFIAGAILGGKISIKGLNRQSVQGDKYIIEVLTHLGCSFSFQKNVIVMTKNSDVPLKSFNLDMGKYPDLVIPLAMYAIFANQPSIFTNIGHLRLKESDRIHAIQSNLSSIGVKSTSTEDSLMIYPNLNAHGSLIESYGDHRIAMSFAIAGLRIPGIILNNPSCVKKSYPNFFDHLEKISSNQIKNSKV